MEIMDYSLYNYYFIQYLLTQDLWRMNIKRKYKFLDIPYLAGYIKCIDYARR